MTNANLMRVSDRRNYEAVAAQIAEMIKSEGFKPGDRLPTERELSTRLEVSRAVVRDAVKVLGAAGLVQARHGSGLYITASSVPTSVTAAIDLSMRVDPEHIEGLYHFRRTIETEVARLAAETLTLKDLRALEAVIDAQREAANHGDAAAFRTSDVAFHQGLADVTRNPFFASAVSTTQQLQNWAVDSAVARTPGSLLGAVDQHASILNAIADGDGAVAAAAMQLHIDTSLNNYRQEARRRLMGEG